MKTSDIADYLSGELIGDGSREIERVAALSSASPSEIAFSISSIDLSSTNASCVIVPLGFEIVTPITVIKVKDPKFAFARIAAVLHPDEKAGFIDRDATIAYNASIGLDCRIHAGTRVGRNVNIGDNTIIFSNCVIYDNVTIGRDCVIHAGTVIGSPGFGYVADADGEHFNFPQIGSVVIEDSVEIGANCCVDRGALGETRIGAGTKIDNLVQVAHNVKIGKRVIIAAQSGIAGSSVIEDDVVIAGQVGIADHVRVKAGAVIGAKSAVFPNKIVARGFWSGIPVQPVRDYRKQHAHIKSIGRLKEEVRSLRKQIDLYVGKSDDDDGV
ncbi:MAG: UDP-3-O-(3-hydroxymyristoyl)glucosamine N-acyltransferase [Acidobacteriota bacterium]